MRETTQTIEGNPCHHGHTNANGKTVRYAHGRRDCVQCVRQRYAESKGRTCADTEAQPAAPRLDDGLCSSMRWRQSNPEAYAAYQREYHQRLRRERPDRLEQYRTVQVAKGNTTSKYTKPKQERGFDTAAFDSEGGTLD